MHRRYHFIQFPVVHSHPPRAIGLPDKPHRKVNGFCAGHTMSIFASSAMVVLISLWPPDKTSLSHSHCSPGCQQHLWGMLCISPQDCFYNMHSETEFSHRDPQHKTFKDIYPQNIFWNWGHIHSVHLHRNSPNFQWQGHSLYFNVLATTALNICSVARKIFLSAMYQAA